MNELHIKAVTKATEGIFNTHFGVDAKTLKIYNSEPFIESNTISVIIGVIGQLDGQVICSFDSEVAKKIVGAMMGGMEVDVLDDMGFSAIQEFGNWIAGVSVTELSKVGLICDVTPPIINEGNSKFRSNQIFNNVDIATAFGDIVLSVSLKLNDYEINNV